MVDAEHLKSALLEGDGFAHAFFTRRGGVSQGPFATLNFSLAVGDSEPDVTENLRRAGRALGVAPEHVHFLSQVHGRAVHEVNARLSRTSVVRQEGDVVWSSDPECACGVRSADCVPVLLADPRSGQVAAVHAGWRGLVVEVIRAGVEALTARGTRADELLAAIGPHISVSAFEVSLEVAHALRGACTDPNVVVHDLGPRPHVSLRRVARSQLIGLGLLPRRIDDVLGCTHGQPEAFFSFRRDGRQSGRHLSAIVPRAPRR